MEVRFESVHFIGKTRFLRIPIVRGRANFSRGFDIPETAILYLTEVNMSRVHEALRHYQSLR